MNVVIELEEMGSEALVQRTNRAEDINNSYRSIAEKMGQLYMCADESKVHSLTRGLDKPMRNASDNQQAFAAILDKLKMFVTSRKG